MQLPYLSIVSQAGGKLNDRLIELFSKIQLRKKEIFCNVWSNRGNCKN